MKIETSIDKSQLESDKKINEIVNKYERDKIDTQRQHTKIFQDLVDETNFRLKKVESEYNQQLIVNVSLDRVHNISWILTFILLF